MMKLVDEAAIRPCLGLSHSLPTPLSSQTALFLLHPFSLLFWLLLHPPFPPAGPLLRKGDTRGPSAVSPITSQKEKKKTKTKKPASPGSKKQALPKGSLVLRLSRQPEYLIVLECQERQGSPWHLCLCRGGNGLRPARSSHWSEEGCLASGYKDSLDPRPGLLKRDAHSRAEGL